MARRANEALALVWERRIARQRRSQRSVAEFCGQEGVSPKSFYAWRRRLQVHAAPARSGLRGPASPLFVPVELPASPASPSSGVRIELPGGAVLVLPADASEALLTAAIRAVLCADSERESAAC